MEFDGSPDTIAVPNNTNLSPTQITVSYWVKLNSLANGQGRISKDGQYLMTLYNGKFEIVVWRGSVPQLGNRNEPGGTTAVTGKW